MIKINLYALIFFCFVHTYVASSSQNQINQKPCIIAPCGEILYFDPRLNVYRSKTLTFCNTHIAGTKIISSWFICVKLHNVKEEDLTFVCKNPQCKIIRSYDIEYLRRRRIRQKLQNFSD